MASVRREIVSRLTSIQPIEDAHITSGDALKHVQDEYGIYSFNDKAMKEKLPSHVYSALKKDIQLGKPVDPSIADVVAGALKQWAVGHGATHFTHWFQPYTIANTAEKHDSFLSIFPGQEVPIFDFNGSELIRGEPDASSFPSGGLRATYQARGYTFWDPTSPAFVRKTASGATLYIPTAFCSWSGEALDEKTPLLRSTEKLNEACLKLLRLSGDNDTQNVYSTLGVEQEFFLIDRAFYLARPDLVAAGRTLFGAAPAKGQELEDQYFANIPRRVLTTIQEMEHKLWQLGMPAKTRHNEVAPAQYEMAPIFERATIATDHNLLQMTLLGEVAQKHGLQLLLHEKPFQGVNGSGKHNNWSISTNRGENLLNPGKTPLDNARFLMFLTAVIRAVDVHADLLRVSVANPGQEYRLGANEAPPAIMSVYLGDELDNVVKELIGAEGKTARKESKMLLGVTVMPPLTRDRTDRNRTSPFAFTGNKFEFRAVGSSQSSGMPNTIMNTIVADSVLYLHNEIKRVMDEKGFGFQIARQSVIHETLAKHYRVVFNGDGYSQEWRDEAVRRGLPNLRSSPEAIEALANEKNTKLLESLNVLSATETQARQHIMFEYYCKAINIEANSTHNIAKTVILPAVIKYQKSVADSVIATSTAIGESAVSGQKALLKDISSQIEALIAAIDALKAVHKQAHDLHDAKAEAFFYNTKVIPAMKAVRTAADSLENVVDDDLWPLPKYSEILFLR
eukprot:TRINITY_DN7381_c0_g1_i1.p1 TRINITY_DN7381_c0_g1~~TRINITY_DN7381_c0_g1_i1.p1  ORF type:complete len:736 (-),score=310.33 TRINITY_DN7381_c0_g1_i1:238-2445(-)